MKIEEIYLNLKNISTLIYIIYQRLTKLEIEHKESSIEYENQLEALDSLLKMEKYYYGIIIKQAKKNYGVIIDISAENLKNTTEKMPKDTLIHDTSIFIYNELEEEDLIAMRMSYKLYELYIKLKEEDSIDNQVINGYEPKRDKYFLDIISDEIIGTTDKKNRKKLIQAKYTYAFIHPQKEEVQIENEDYVNAIVAIKNSSEIMDYASMISQANKEEIVKSQKKYLLSFLYSRACLLQMESLMIETLRETLVILNKIDETTANDGAKAFMSLFDCIDEDRKKYLNRNYKYERKY